MAIIELTKTEGKKIFINTSHIIFFQIGENEDRCWTNVVTSQGSIWVRETIEQIAEKINEVK